MRGGDLPTLLGLQIRNLADSALTESKAQSAQPWSREVPSDSFNGSNAKMKTLLMFVAAALWSLTAAAADQKPAAEQSPPAAAHATEGHSHTKERSAQATKDPAAKPLSDEEKKKMHMHARDGK
ncbi:hypothetical protein [Niveibacterium sp.]|uniref:hypothetical protein n=1 Tax=Niveibacterium sp. TaxID=2017444 RepID=UPI0035ADCBA2